MSYKETRDVGQNSHGSGRIDLSEVAHKTSATTSVIDSVKNLELTKIPDGCRAF